jgi:hypothetical protein
VQLYKFEQAAHPAGQLKHFFVYKSGKYPLPQLLRQLYWFILTLYPKYPSLHFMHELELIQLRQFELHKLH